jgi:glucosamine--fructose-6-phosphate aminotransferase (isomerizing)
MAIIGKKDAAATALLAGLILKEAAKVPAEGYIGGQFRHGPLEMAGQGLTAVIIADPDGNGSTESSLAALARDLVDADSDVLLVGGTPVDGVTHLPVTVPRGLASTAVITRIMQQLSVDLAYAKNLVPGQFRYGQKITSAL